MKKNFFIFSFLVAILLACHSQNSTTDRKKDSKTKDSFQVKQMDTPLASVTIEEELFKINFPEFPEKTEDSTDKTVEYLLSQKNDSVRFLLYYRDYKTESIEKFGGAEKFLQNQEKQVIEGQKFTEKDIVENRKILLNGYPGLSLKAGAAGNFFLVYRIYLVKNRVYQLGISSMTKYPTEKEIEDFFGSFQLKTPTDKISKS
jgi:hypothetical protein